MIATPPSGLKSGGIVGGGGYMPVMWDKHACTCVCIQMSAIAKLLAMSEAVPPTSPDHVFDMSSKSFLLWPGARLSEDFHPQMSHPSTVLWNIM